MGAVAAGGLPGDGAEGRLLHDAGGAEDPHAGVQQRVLLAVERQDVHPHRPGGPVPVDARDAGGGARGRRAGARGVAHSACV